MRASSFPRLRVGCQRSWAFATAAFLTLAVDASAAEDRVKPALQDPAFGSPVSATGSRISDPLSTKGPGDGIYGRLRGDFSYRVEVGVSSDLGTKTWRPLAGVGLVFYQTLGLEAALSQRVGQGDPMERTLSLGLTVTPLFLLRWPQSKEWGYAFWDLALDSVGVALGTALMQPRSEKFAAEQGLQVGLLAGLPLLSRANGPWLRLRANLVTGRPPIDGQDPVEVTLWMTLAWQGFFHTGLLHVD